jgi:hypothetical protein
VLARLGGAVIRALLVSLMVAIPALLLPAGQTDVSHIVLVLSLLAGLLAFLEYSANLPSIVEFRDAPPFNRLRFGAVFVNVLVLTIVIRGQFESMFLTQMLYRSGSYLGGVFDFPYSPIQFMLWLAPVGEGQATAELIRVSAGLAFLNAIAMIFGFIYLRIGLRWPANSGVFNVWVNLPLFDPSAGGDVLDRLKGDARFNIAFGLAALYAVPLVIKAAASFLDPATFTQSQTLIWTITAWAFLPANMILRGLAMGRIASMIGKKRRRKLAAAGY